MRLALISAAAGETGTDWTSIGVAAVGVTGTLLGIWIGWLLDRRARREERFETLGFELRKDASSVLGEAQIAISITAPDGYALWATEEFYAKLQYQREEWLALRERIAALAARWPEGAPALQSVEQYLSNAPAALSNIVATVLDGRDFQLLVETQRHAYEDANRKVAHAIQQLHGTESRRDSPR